MRVPVMTSLATLLLPVLLCNSVDAAPITLRFDQPNYSVTTGEVISLSILADFPDPVAGWGLDLLLDPSILHFDQATVLVGSAWFPAFASDDDNLAGLAFPSSVTGNGVELATLLVRAVNPGTTTITLSITPGDLSEGFVLDSGAFAELDGGTSSVVVTAVPEPSTVWLICGGALFLCGRAAARSRFRLLQSPRHKVKT